MESFLMTGKQMVLTGDTGPGPTTLLYQHRNSDTDYFGYYGEVPIAESTAKLLSGNDMRFFLGEGVVYKTDMVWHKFLLNGKILFIPLGGPVRKITYNYLRNKDYVNPSKPNISNAGRNYKLRLPDMAPGVDALSSTQYRNDSEFAKLIAPLLKGIASPATGGVKWGSFTMEFYATGTAQESYFFGMEMYSAYAMAYGLTKPATGGYTIYVTDLRDYMHWLPVLELVP